MSVNYFSIEIQTLTDVYSLIKYAGVKSWEVTCDFTSALCTPFTSPS